MGSATITLRRLGAYLRAHGVNEWAEYIEALPPDSEEARAFERSQAEIGHPDPFKPRTDLGRFMRKNLRKVEPNPLALSVLVSLEGLAEQLAPGEYFPKPLRNGENVPRSPADYESRVVAARLTGHALAAAGLSLTVTWATGLLVPLERVDVEESVERVTVTVWERHPPRFREGGAPALAHAAVRVERCAEVALATPLGPRELVDGATGLPSL